METATTKPALPNYEDIGPWSLFALWEEAAFYLLPEADKLHVSELIGNIYHPLTDEQVWAHVIAYHEQVGYSPEFLDKYVNKH